MKQEPINDLDLKEWKTGCEGIRTSSFWDIPRNDDPAGADFHGRFVREIPEQLIKRFTRKNDLVLDLFAGSGTTLRAAIGLQRRACGIDLDQGCIDRMREAFQKKGADDRICVLRADSAAPSAQVIVRSVLYSKWGQDHADLVLLHPPYSDVIRFTEHPDDLSAQGDDALFLIRMRAVCRNAYCLLKPGRYAALVMGDKYRGGEWVPLGFQTMQCMQRAGFILKSIVVKNVAGNEIGKGKRNNLWRYRALRHGFYVFGHEYLFLFQRPEKS